MVAPGKAMALAGYFLFSVHQSFSAIPEWLLPLVL